MQHQQDDVLASAILETVRLPLLTLNADLRVETANDAFLRQFRVTRAQTLGRLIYDLGNGQWDISELRQLLEDVLPRQQSFADYEITHTFEGIGERAMLLNGRRLDHLDLIVLAIRDVTDVRESASRLKDVVKAAHIGLFEDDRCAGTLFWSPEMRDILGYPQDQPPPPAGTVPDFVHPDDREAVAAMYAKLLDGQGDGAVTHDHHIVRPDGEARWVQITAQTEFAESAGERRPVRLRGVFRDVTERKFSDERLRESERRLRSVLDSMDEAFGLMDRDFRILTQNEAALPLDRRLRDDILGRTHWEVYPGSEESELGSLLKHAMADRVPVTLEHSYEWPSGGESWLEMRAYPVPEGLAVFWLDITERKEAEAAPRESEAHFRALVSSTFDIIYRMNSDWTEMRKLGGRGFITDTHEPRRNWMEGYIPSEDQPKVAAAIRNAIRAASQFDLEHRVRQVDGSIGWVHSRAVPLFDDTHGLREWFGAASDVTPRKRAEEHQNMLMAVLDHRVKNIPAIVQSIARQSLGRGQAVGPEAADQLVGRINALAVPCAPRKQPLGGRADQRPDRGRRRPLSRRAGGPRSRRGAGFEGDAEGRADADPRTP